MLDMYKGMVNSPETTITNDINAEDTIIYVLDETKVPEELPNLMTLGTGTSAETVKVLEVNGNALTVERGFQGTPRSWNAGTVIARNFTEYDYNALKENIETLDKEIGNLDSLSTEEKSNLVGAINEVYADLTSHKAEKVHQGEVHGMRFNERGKLEVWNGVEWIELKGGGLPVNITTNIQAVGGDKQVELTWQDPEDVLIEGETVVKWKSTAVVRKQGSMPKNDEDGVLITRSSVRNQYRNTPFVDTNGLENDKEYFYGIFPQSEDEIVTVSEKEIVSAIPTAQKIYGVRIDKNNSNPETRVTYIGNAVGFQPMRGNNGNFSWGSWKEVFESFEIRPCVLKNGVVQYYLNPNDFTKKADGSNSNLTGADGDVMIEFGKTLWWKWTDEGTTYTIEISDKEFDGAVKHAFEIEEGYNLVPYYALLLTQVLFVIFFKSTDSQAALGRGRVDGAEGYAATGGTNTKGMFYGSEADEQMKFLGIEDYWGNKFWWIDGLVTDENYNLLIAKNNFNDNGVGYQSFNSGITENISGYIDSVQGGNDKGFIIKSKNGSETTYYADYGNLYSGRVARFGGIRSDRSNAGFACLRLDHAASVANATFGARLFCASDGKIYIGAYLGTSVSGKLRSISGTAEPTGNKTIGTFRAEAKANN